MSKVTKISVRDAFEDENVPERVKALSFEDADNPYIPTKNENYVFRKDVLREGLAFLNAPGGDALFITGPTGSGKTTVVTEIAARLNWPVQQISFSGHVEMSDLVGHHMLVSEKPGEPPVMKFQYGPLAIAARDGHILLINEWDYGQPEELGGLNDVLEGKPLVIAQNGGEVIKPHPMFRVVATGNSAGQGDMSGLYQGIQMQNLATMDRFRMSRVWYPESQVEEDILAKATPKLPENVRQGMVRVAGLVRNLFFGEDGQDGQLAVTMSTRTLLRWSKLSLAFRGAPNALEYALEISLLNRASDEDSEAILRVAKDVFGDQWR